MSISDKIKKSKEKIKYSEKINVSYNLYKLLNEFDEKKDDKNFLITIPINIVSSNESFFKEIISSLIDHEEKYLNNSKTLIKKNNIRIDLEDIYHITKSNFSLGDLLAYSFKYSSFESIFNTFESVSNIKVFEKIEEVKKALIPELDIETSIDEKNFLDKNRLFKNLKEVYEVRNVICHDFLSTTHKLILEPEKIKEYLTDAYIFQELITFSLDVKVYSIDTPKTTQESIEYYNSIISERIKVLNSLYDKLRINFSTKKQEDNLQETKKCFENFLEFDSKNIPINFNNEGIEFTPFEDLGLIYKLKLINQRIKNIEDEINYSS
jgi:hypothetical protein